jgi:predicted GNAT family acetyltransferase
LGIFFEENVARYQTVGTHPNYRRRGICGSLVYQTALHTLEKYGVDTLVMLADPDYHAARIYESVGFQPEEMQYGVQWWSGADPEKTDG